MRSGSRCNPCTMEKPSAAAHSFCPRLADPSAATISPSRFCILIQMHWPGLSLADVGAPSDTVLRVYSLIFFFFFHELKQVVKPTSPLSSLAGRFAVVH